MAKRKRQAPLYVQEQRVMTTIRNALNQLPFLGSEASARILAAVMTIEHGQGWEVRKRGTNG